MSYVKISTCENRSHVAYERDVRSRSKYSFGLFFKAGGVKKKFELPRDKNFFSCSFEVVIKSGYIQPWVEGSLWKCAVPGVAVQPRVPPGWSLQRPRCGQGCPQCWGGHSCCPWLWQPWLASPALRAPSDGWSQHMTHSLFFAICWLLDKDKRAGLFPQPVPDSHCCSL